MKTLFLLLLLGTSSLAAANTRETDSRRSEALYPERISNLQASVATKNGETVGATSAHADGPLSIVELVRHEVTWIWVGEDVERPRVRRLR